MNTSSLRPDAETATALSADKESSDQMMPTYFIQQDLLGNAAFGGRISSLVKTTQYTTQ